MDSYYERIFWLFLYLDLGGFLNSWPFEGRKGSDVTRKAVLALFKRALTDKSFVVVVIEQPSAVQTMPEFLRRYGKQLYHTWNFNFLSRQRRKLERSLAYIFRVVLRLLLYTIVKPKHVRWLRYCKYKRRTVKQHKPCCAECVRSSRFKR